MNLLYDPPYPTALTVKGTEAGARGLRSAKIDGTATYTDLDGRTTLRVTEVLPKDADRYSTLPIAVAPSGPLNSKSINDALRELAVQVTTRLEGVSPGTVDAAAALPAPVRDLLLRRPPTLAGELHCPQLRVRASPHHPGCGALPGRLALAVPGSPRHGEDPRWLPRHR